MSHGTRGRIAILSSLTAAALVPFAVTLGACGGAREKPPETPPMPSAAPSPSATETAASSGRSASARAAPSETASAPAPPPPPNPGSTKASKKTEAAWASCHQTYAAKQKDVAKDVAAMAKACAKETKMKIVGQTIAGKQGDQDPPQSYPLKAEANHCYRVYAQAAEGIKDLDLAIKDSAGAVAGEDSTDDASPVVMEDGAVCFKEKDAATVVVSVGMGGGAYALQIWAD